LYYVVYELLYLCTPFAVASHHWEESKLKPYKNNSVNNSDKNINDIFDPNEYKQLITKHNPIYDKKVTEIIGNSEKSELDVMTFHEVIRVANENTRENLYIPVSLLGSVS